MNVSVLHQVAKDNFPRYLRDNVYAFDNGDGTADVVAIDISWGKIIILTVDMADANTFGADVLSKSEHRITPDDWHFAHLKDSPTALIPKYRKVHHSTTVP